MAVLGGLALSYERGSSVDPTGGPPRDPIAPFHIFRSELLDWAPTSKAKATHGFTGNIHIMYNPPRLRSYRDTSLTRNRTTLGPCRRPMPRVLGGS
jgi:hypothetical protein